MFITKRHLECFTFVFRCFLMHRHLESVLRRCRGSALWVNVVHVSLDSYGRAWKWSDTHWDTAACWAAVSLRVPATNKRKKGRRSRICSSGSLPYLLSLSGFYLANGGLHAGWCEASLKPPLHCTNCVLVCGRVWACLNSMEFSYRSVTGSFDARGPTLFSSVCGTHTHNPETRGGLFSSYVRKGSAVPKLCCSKQTQNPSEPAHQTAREPFVFRLFH